MKSIIIIFSDWDSVYRNQASYELSWVPMDENPKKFSFSNGKLIIAYDQEFSVERDDFGEIVNEIQKGDEVYILHHTHPVREKLENFSKLLSGKGAILKRMIQKMHSEADYRKIQEIDKCLKSEASNLQDIFEWYLARFSIVGNKIELALEFLHECMPVKEKADIEKLQNFPDFPKIKELLDQVTGDCKSEQYRKSFGLFRDELMKQAGA